MPIRDLLRAEHVIRLTGAADRDAVLDAAARVLADADPDASAHLAEGLRRRERTGSTAIGHGVAIPHARSQSLRQPRGAFLHLREPVDFDAHDGAPVDLVFALAVPQDEVQRHLQWLAELAERFSEPALRQRLRECGNSADLYATLAGPAP